MKLNGRLISICFLLPMLVVSPQSAGAQEASDEISKKNEGYQQFYNSGRFVESGGVTIGALASSKELRIELDSKVAFLRELYADDAVLLLPLSEPVVGMDNIISLQIEALGRFTDVQLKRVKFDEKGDFAVEVGTYSSIAVLPAEDAEDLPLTGTFMNVWTKDADGEWRITASSSMGSAFKGPEYAYWTE